MIKINKDKPILVTGATGYVAGWIIRKLLKDGFTVHAAVRNPEDEKKRKYLDNIAQNSLGNIKYFKTDLLDEGSYDEAMQNCELVFHTASPFIHKVSDPQKELINPALRGTKNIIGAINRCQSVKRMVLTSSVAAIFGDTKDLLCLPNGTADESYWNTSSTIKHQAYSYSKTIAEKEAWTLNEMQNRWDLVTINPVLILGPGINAQITSESLNLFRQLADGTMKFGAPNMDLGVVDVRDVATAHINAGFSTTAKGRHIIAADHLTFLQMAKILNKKYPNQYPFPKTKVPTFLAWLFAPLVGIDRKMVINNFGYPWLVDNTKSIKELALKYRPIEETLLDHFEQLIKSGIITKK